MEAEKLTKRTAYWYSVWSHRRNHVWKGFMQVDLAPAEDASASARSDAVSDVGQVRTSIERLSQENLREEQEALRGELQGGLPKARAFEFKLVDSSQVIRGKIAPTITDPDALNRELHREVRTKVMVTRVGGGRPRYLLIEGPGSSPST